MQKSEKLPSQVGLILNQPPEEFQSGTVCLPDLGPDSFPLHWRLAPVWKSTVWFCSDQHPTHASLVVKTPAAGIWSHVNVCHPLSTTRTAGCPPHPD